ncbi:MAG: hypothetical protein JOZ19_03540 [Rubrobacter sp.]|nr:hypothetical protein [Rubrobacter sp.]
MDEQQNQLVLDPAKILVGGIASPMAALLTSRFDIARTMIGLALSAVIVTTITDILKVYLARPNQGGQDPRWLSDTAFLAKHWR